MRVLVTGAGGFIGTALSRRLLAQGLAGRRVERLVAVDLGLPEQPADDRRLCVLGSIADGATLARALAEPVDVVFHLASVPGGATEKDPALGRRVNLDATLQLLDGLASQARPARLVFASSIAVYGESLPARVDEDTPALPALSYGAHKLAAEILVADAARRGALQACSLRLPGVVARPGEGAGLISAFMSRLFWALRAGEAVVLPVSAEGTAWWISVDACVHNLLHAASLDDAALGPRRVVQMPAQHLSMQQVIDAAVRVHGADRRGLVRHEPRAEVQRLFASYPPLRTPRADALGFRHDGTPDELVRRATAA